MTTFELALRIRTLVTFVLSLFGVDESKVPTRPEPSDALVRAMAQAATPDRPQEHLDPSAGRRTVIHTWTAPKPSPGPAPSPSLGRAEIRIEGQDKIVVESYKMSDGQETKVMEIISIRVP